MNQEIELHDSEIAEVTREGEDFLVVFSHAYVHESAGTPGVDSGVGLSQRAELRILTGQPTRLPPQWPVRIAAGELHLGNQVLHNMLPVQLEFEGPTTLSLTVYDDDSVFTQLRISGEGARVATTGPASYIEDFTGSGSSTPPN